MQLLNDADRAFILAQLQLAPDEILADAMLAFNATRDKIVKVRALVPSVAPVLKEESPVPTEGLDADVGAGMEVKVSRVNISPGAPVTSKVLVPTKNTILFRLNEGIQPGEKYLEAAKLMWSRGEIKFDGKDFYF